MQEAALPREYRHDRRHSTAVIVLLVGKLVLLGILSLELPWPGWLKGLILALFAAFVALAIAARPRQFTRVDGQGVTRCNGLGVRRLAWSELHDIRTVTVPQPNAGASIVTYAYLGDGRRLLLPCVDDEELPDAEREALVLRSLLEELRGADWTPDAQAEARIARQNARWERLYRPSTAWWIGGGIVVAIMAGVLGYAAFPGPS
ncbi:PH domain-containing protein [Streptomyces sp. NPDC054849]